MCSVKLKGVFDCKLCVCVCVCVLKLVCVIRIWNGNILLFKSIVRLMLKKHSEMTMDVGTHHVVISAR